MAGTAISMSWRERGVRMPNSNSRLLSDSSSVVASRVR